MIVPIFSYKITKSDFIFLTSLQCLKILLIGVNNLEDVSWIHIKNCVINICFFLNLLLIFIRFNESMIIKKEKPQQTEVKCKW